IDQRNDPDGDADDWITINTIDWPYAWPPIHHCQNMPAPNEFWGVSDVEDDLLDLNARINFLMSNAAKIVHFHGHPKTWGTGFDANEVEVGIDDTLILPDQATLQSLEMSGGELALDLYAKLREAVHEQARTPEIATGKLEGIGQLSGLALMILF